MEDHRLIQMEEDTAEEVCEEEDIIEEEDEEDEDYDYEDEEDEDYEDGEDEDDDYEDEDEDAEDNEGEEVEELIPSETTISSFIADGSADDSNVRDEKPVSQENDGNDGGQKELNRGEIDVCPICFIAWTSGGDHRICCLPCGHIYGMSCIKRWLLRCQSDGKCPQCKSFCTLKDIRVLYATRLCVAEETSPKTTPPNFPYTKEGFIEFQQYVSSRMDTFQQRLDTLERHAEECDSLVRCLQQRQTELLGQVQDNNQ